MTRVAHGRYAWQEARLSAAFPESVCLRHIPAISVHPPGHTVNILRSVMYLKVTFKLFISASRIRPEAINVLAISLRW